MDEIKTEDELKREKNREWYAANKEEQQKKARERYEAHKAELRAKANERRKGKVRADYNPETRRAWYEKNKERLLAKKREWEAAHPEKKQEWNRTTYLNDRGNRIAYEKEKRDSVPGVLLLREDRQERAAWFEQHPGLVQTWSKYQDLFTWEQFTVLTAQMENGTCDICGKPREGNRRLRVDHDHKTEKFRGLLCHDCNVGLGHFKDDPDLLQKAIDYLQKAAKAA